jgi:hypothetical protein
MSRKVVIFVSCGVASDGASAWNIPDGVSDEELENFAWEQAKEFAEMYGVYPPEFDDDGEEIEQEEALHGFCWDDVEGYWEPYNSAKHDGHLLYGYNDKVKFQDY